MRTVFFGTPSWAVPSLRALAASDIDVVAVVTNPDRPAGRGMKLTSSPVKVAAQELGVAVIQDRAKSPELLEQLGTLAPDVAVVVAYGSILPANLLDVPPDGFVNLHFSLLPAYRGAAPVQRAIMDGEKMSGASLMVLTEGMDEGPVIATREVPISPDDSSATYGGKLADIGAALLIEKLPEYVDHRITPVPQDDSKATYANKLTTEDAQIDWTQPSASIDALVRGLDPEPGAWTTLRGARVKVFKVIGADEGGLAPGAVTVNKEGVVVGTGDGAVRLVEVQPATKKRMGGVDFAHGLRVSSDDRMGE